MTTPNGPLCGSCVMPAQGAKGYMIPSGTGRNGVMIVAEALGHHEALQSTPLVGESGFLLGQIFKRKGWKREDFTLANILWCQPPGNKLLGAWYQDQAIHHCAPNLERLIQERQPKVIVALGGIAFEELTGIYGLPVEDFRGYVHRDRKDERWVIGSWHPAFLLRGQFPQTTALMLDIEKALRIAKEGYEYEIIESIENPPLGEWEDLISHTLRELRDDPSLPLAIDIETPFSKGRSEDELEEDPSYTINCFSFSCWGKKGVTQLWQPFFLDGIQALLKTENPKLIWNRPFDLPRLLHNKMVVQGEVRDTMDGAWHFLYSGLKRGLGYATSILQHRFPMWKHLAGQSPEKYSVYDAVALFRNHQTLMRLHREMGSQQAYGVFVEQTDAPLQAMTSAGVVIDVPYRDALAGELAILKKDTLQEMEQIVPQSVKPLKVYKTLKPVKDRSFEIVKGKKKVKVCSACGAEGVKKTHVTKKGV